MLAAVPQLRWKKVDYSRYVLQQYWVDPLGGETEWRDVPFVDPEQPEQPPKLPRKRGTQRVSPVVYCGND